MKAATRVRELAIVGYAYTRNEAVEDFSYPLTIVFQQLTLTFPVFIYYFIAELNPARAGQAAARVGGDYLTFVVIGLAAAAALQAALAGFGQRLQTANNKGQFETLLVEPVPWRFIPIAMNLWRTFLGVVGAGTMLGIGVLLGADFRLGGLGAFLLVLVLGLVACTAIGCLSACVVVLSKRSQPLIALYGLAASLLGGAVFPIAVMPEWLRALSWLIPHSYVINGARQALMQVPPVATVSLQEAIIGLVIFNIVVVTISLYLFGKSLDYAREMGLLGDY
jgi:ABC-2 type transport system permease protein